MSARHSGLRHWRLQRVTAMALLPLSLWFVFSLILLPDLSRQSVLAWLASGWAAAAMALLLVLLAWHSALGVQVVIEDYVSVKGGRRSALWLSHLAHAAFALLALLALAAVFRNTTP
jgi:succinate dehydrogenase / fumarate reductase membrane anchor subunit